jgi:hypothetical protein
MAIVGKAARRMLPFLLKITPHADPLVRCCV